MSDTRDEEYARRLDTLGRAGWKRHLDVQAPYRFNLRRQRLGRTLEVGCGVGRNLGGLPAGSLGVDHNATSVEIARARGFAALTSAEWAHSELNRAGAFDALLLAHVVEHMTFAEGVDLVRAHLPALRPGGRVFFICPQERGYRSDPTHVRFMSGPDLELLARRAGLVPEQWRRFPFPHLAGRFVTYNEFTLLAHKPGTGESP
jgi:SAM-dependent methyltransferase